MECLEINEIGYKWGRNKVWLIEFLSFTYFILVNYFQLTFYLNWKSRQYIMCVKIVPRVSIYVSQSLTTLDSYLEFIRRILNVHIKLCVYCLVRG